MKRTLPGILTVLLFLYLILSPVSCVEAALAGLLQWFHFVVPSLFPLMILSQLLISSGMISLLLAPAAFFTKHLFGIGLYGTYALLIGFLCGYPMGVKILRDLHDKGLISGQECRYLAGFINNVSPGFLITYVSVQQFHTAALAMPTIAIVYGSSALYGVLSRFFIPGEPESEREKFVETGEKKTSFSAQFFALIDVCILDSIHQIVRLGGYMILFAVISSVLKLIPTIPSAVKAVLSGILEITNGISQIAALSLPLKIRYLLGIVCLAFGGLCSALQSGELLKNFGGTLHSYIKTKAMTAIIALLFAALYLF